MLLYDVTWPRSRDLDSAVPWEYLQRLALDKRNEGALATCINGEGCYVLRRGEWMEPSKISSPQHG